MKKTKLTWNEADRFKLQTMRLSLVRLKGVSVSEVEWLIDRLERALEDLGLEPRENGSKPG